MITINTVFYELPRGKPDPAQPRPIGPDLRPRIPQQGQKGPTCFYYALQRLRDHYGKSSEDAFPNERKIEKWVSEWRKSLTEANSYRISGSALQKQYPQLLSTLEGGQQLLALLKKAAVAFPTETSTIARCVRLVSIFCQQTKHANFADFSRELHERSIENSHQDLLKKLEKDPAAYYAQSPIRIRYSNVPWMELSSLLRGILLQRFCIFSVLEQYRFKKSSWNPSKPVEELIQSLEQQGPMMIGGFFGKSFYAAEPSVMKERFAGREILYWPKGTEPKTQIDAHAILLIGAEKTRSLVYFLDPLDRDDPDSPQRIYAMSYRKLQEACVNFWAESSRTGGVIMHDAPYGVYSPVQFPKTIS